MYDIKPFLIGIVDGERFYVSEGLFMNLSLTYTNDLIKNEGK